MRVDGGECQGVFVKWVCTGVLRGVYVAFSQAEKEIDIFALSIYSKGIKQRRRRGMEYKL